MTKEESTKAFNSMPFEYRKIVSDHLIHDHILHLEQAKAKAVRAHKALIADYNSHINNLKKSITNPIKPKP